MAETKKAKKDDDKASMKPELKAVDKDALAAGDAAAEETPGA